MPTPATPLAVMPAPQAGAARALAPGGAAKAPADASSFAAMLGEQAASDPRARVGAETAAKAAPRDAALTPERPEAARAPSQTLADEPAELEARPTEAAMDQNADAIGTETEPAPQADAARAASQIPDGELAGVEAPKDYAVRTARTTQPEAAPADPDAPPVLVAGTAPGSMEPQPRPLDVPGIEVSNGEAASGEAAGPDAAAQWRAAQQAGETRALRDALHAGAQANANAATRGGEPQASAQKAGAKVAADAKMDVPPGADKSATPATPAAKPSPEPASEPIQRPEAPAQAVKAAADVGLEGEAALKDARVISERAPGDVLRAAIKPEADKSNAGSTHSQAAPARAAADAKPAAASAPSTPSTPAAPASPAQNPAALFVTAPGFDLALAPFTAQIIGEAGAAQPDLDPALMKADGGMDPAGLRLDAKTEVRTASTLQFAQGPRFTPHSAQTLAAQIAQRFSDGARVFDIRLDPPELGRVEVRLELGSDNSVRALLAAERAETLAELQRSARDLERVLADAGLELGENALSFSLTDDRASAKDGDADGFSGAAPVVADSAALDAGEALNAPITSYGFLLARAERLDVSV